MPFRKLIPTFTLTGSPRRASVILNQIDVCTMDVNNKIKEYKYEGKGDMSEKTTTKSSLFFE